MAHKTTIDVGYARFGEMRRRRARDRYHRQDVEEAVIEQQWFYTTACAGVGQSVGALSKGGCQLPAAPAAHAYCSVHQDAQESYL